MQTTETTCQLCRTAGTRAADEANPDPGELVPDFRIGGRLACNDCADMLEAAEELARQLVRWEPDRDADGVPLSTWGEDVLARPDQPWQAFYHVQEQTSDEEVVLSHGRGRVRVFPSGLDPDGLPTWDWEVLS